MVPARGANCVRVRPSLGAAGFASRLDAGRLLPPPHDQAAGRMGTPGVHASSHRFRCAPRSHQATTGRSRIMFAAGSGSPRLQKFHSSFAAREYWKRTWSTSKASRTPARKPSIASPSALQDSPGSRHNAPRPLEQLVGRTWWTPIGARPRHRATCGRTGPFTGQQGRVRSNAGVRRCRKCALTRCPVWDTTSRERARASRRIDDLAYPPGWTTPFS